MTNSQHIYEVRPRKDHRGFDLISDALPIGAGSGTSNPITQSTMRSFAVDQITPAFAFAMKLAI
jgi:hypothetical protein